MKERSEKSLHILCGYAIIAVLFWKQTFVCFRKSAGMAQSVEQLIRNQQVGGSSPPTSSIKTHAKGAHKTPPRVSFSMQNRGKLPFSWQFTLFVVSSLIAVGICSSLAFRNRKPLTISQKGFLHDK